MIGDPSGRSVTRPQLSREQVLANAESYREQAFKVLDPARTTIVYNGEWFAKMGFEEIIRLNSRVTLQQMLQREDFRERVEQQQPIHAHEIQYPIMQGWDSVQVQADVELGGTDQLFNILVGRDFQKQEGIAPQVVFLLPILEGLDGVKKMSKSLGNYIGVNENAADMFGKIMSISDELMARYYPLLLGRELPRGVTSARSQEAARRGDRADVSLALRTRRGWSTSGTRASARSGLADADLPPFRSEAGDAVSVVAAAYAQAFRITRSRGDVRRLIEQGSVQLDGAKLTDPKATLALQARPNPAPR